MKIIIDKNIPFAVSAFKSFGNVEPISTHQFSPEIVKDAEILIVRSEIKVNKELLEGSKVRFVGTATIGTDHIDVEYLKSKGIGFASAPGCNSNSVAEYVISVLLYLSTKFKSPLAGKTLGVVGIGNIGTKVVKYAEALGMNVLQNDPPLFRKTGEKRFRNLNELMEADYITIHVPLTKSGEDKTFHLFDEVRLRKLKKSAILINTSRGPVVETGSIKNVLSSGIIKAAVLDVWENEPNIDIDLLRLVMVGTQHIAGYSLDGKVNATTMIHDAVSKYFLIHSDWFPTKENLPLTVPEIILEKFENTIEEQLYDIIKKCYDPLTDDISLRQILNIDEGERGKYFRQIRAGYRVRREFKSTVVYNQSENSKLANILKSLGFQVK